MTEDGKFAAVLFGFVLWVVGIDYIFIEGLTQRTAGDQLLRIFASLILSGFISVVCGLAYATLYKANDNGILGWLVWLAMMGIWSLPAPLLPIILFLFDNHAFMQELANPTISPIPSHGLSSGPLLVLAGAVYLFATGPRDD